MPGYSILDRDKQNLDDMFICEYCQSVLRDATRASCGHLFCSSCVKHLSLKNPQGVCSRTGVPLFHYESPDLDNSVCNEVLNLAVHCLFSDAGCQWIGTLRDFEAHVGYCSLGSCQGKEMRQAQGYERYSNLEASGGEDLKVMPCVYSECDVVVKTTNDLAEHLENECLYRLERCKVCNEQVRLNAMKLHQTEECGNGGIPQVKKEQLNSTQHLQRQVLSSNVASKIKCCRENSLEFKDEIAPKPKEVASGNSNTRNTPHNSVIDQHEKRLNDLENRVAGHDSLIRENSLLRQNIRQLLDAIWDVSNKVDRFLDCQQRDFGAFQENLNALKNEQINLQARFNRLLEAPLQREELARLNASMEVIHERIARLERDLRSHRGMLANTANTLTALANWMRREEILGVDIQRV